MRDFIIGLCINLIPNLYYVFSYYLFTSKFLRLNVKKNYLIYSSIVYLIDALAIVSEGMSLLPVPNWVYDIVRLAVIIAFFSASFKAIEGKWYKRLLILIMSMVITESLFDKFFSLHQYIIGDAEFGKITLIFSYLLIPILSILIICISSLPGRKAKSKLGLIPLIIIFLTTLIVEVYSSIFGVVVEHQGPINVSLTAEEELVSALESAAGTLNIVLSFTSILIVFLVMIVTNFIITQRYYKRDAEINGAFLESQVRYYESIEKNNQDMKKLRHDYKNHLTVLALLLDNGDVDKAKEYINDIGDSLNSATPLSHTGNTIADAIISDKIQKAQALDINLKVDGQFSYKNMKAIDICSIIGNILDNAIEAISTNDKKFQDDSEKKLSSRDISLNFSKTDSFFVIEETNLSSKPLMLDGDKIVTSKIDKLFHGMGIGNIKESVEKYGGDVDIKCDPSKSHDNEYVFSISIMIPFPIEE